MDALISNFLISVAGGITANAAGKLGEKLIELVRANQGIQDLLQTNPQQALVELAGCLEAMAGSTGEITIDGAQLSALRSATFDHEHGTIRIGNALVEAPFVQTGGTGPGTTEILGGTVLQTPGTSIRVGPGASIKIRGNATIKQT